MVTRATEPKIGELRHHVMLGTEALYRVCAVDERRAQVEVEVVQAPGLQSGQRFSFELAAVRGMAVVEEAADVTPPPAED